jgi:hypothetical protein
MAEGTFLGKKQSGGDVTPKFCFLRGAYVLIQNFYRKNYLP